MSLETYERSLRMVGFCIIGRGDPFCKSASAMTISTILLQTHADWCTAVMTGKTFHRHHKHTCYETYCKVCMKNQPDVHKYCIQPQPPKKQCDGQMYIFYDFQCQLDEEKHVPNLCVVHIVCSKCVELPITDPGCTCDRQ